MELPQILESLQAVIDKTQTLQESEFCDHDHIATWKLDNNPSLKQANGIPLKCDLVGWFPIWFPQSGFEHKLQRHELQLCYHQEFGREAILKGLCEFHGVSRRIIGVLYYGEILVKNANQDDKVFIKSSFNLSLEYTIKRFLYVMFCLRDGSLIPNEPDYLTK